jgi:hypothetical protein
VIIGISYQLLIIIVINYQLSLIIINPAHAIKLYIQLNSTSSDHLRSTQTTIYTSTRQVEDMPPNNVEPPLHQARLNLGIRVCGLYMGLGFSWLMAQDKCIDCRRVVDLLASGGDV